MLRDIMYVLAIAAPVGLGAILIWFTPRHYQIARKANLSTEERKRSESERRDTPPPSDDAGESPPRVD